MKRWKAAAVLALCTVLILRLTQVQAHPAGESPYVPVLGIVTTAAADDRCEAQSAALVHAAADSGWDNVLREAKSASVPLIAVDCSVRGVEGVPLYHIGFDYAGLAERAADVLSASERAVQCGDQPRQGVYS